MKLLKYLRNPSLLVLPLGRRGLLNWMSDERYLSMRYRAMMGKKLDLRDPKTYTAKLQWLKLYDRRPLYTQLADKYEVKSFVRERVGEEYVLPAFGVWDSAEEIDFENLPDCFVLKCTHDSGGLVICKDKAKLNVEEARVRLENARKRNFYYLNREWSYKNIKPRILAEAYLEDTLTGELRDYKFFCFDGEPKLMFIASDRQTPGEDTKFDFFDMDYQHLELINGHPNAAVPPAKPQNFELMKDLARKLSKGLPHVRVDFYEVDGKVYFGEMTFYHFSGTVPLEPEGWDETIGSWLTLPEKIRKKPNET